jgi:hypothetical protein
VFDFYGSGKVFDTIELLETIIVPYDSLDLLPNNSDYSSE